MISLTDVLIFVTFFLATFAIIEELRFNRKYRSGLRHPPSLPRLPLVGSLPFVRKFETLPEYFLEKSYKLGPVFTLGLGNRLVVVLNNLAAIEDAFMKHSSSFSGRTGYYTEKNIFNRNQKGLAFMDYTSEFKKYRRLSLSVMRQFGFSSRSRMENLILTEVAQLVDHIRQVEGKPFDPKPLIIFCASNVPLAMLLGRSRRYEEGMSETCFHVNRFAKGLDPALNLFPILRFLPSHERRLAELKDAARKMLEHIDKDIQKVVRDKSHDCFVSRYIEKEGPGYDHEQLIYTIRDLIAGTIETTGNALDWGLIFFANNPRIVERAQEEIDSVVPRDRLPTIGDQPRLSYTEAVVLEILRLGPNLPFAIPHCTSYDTEVLGFFIPANTVVLPNIKGAHMNRNDWIDPETFMPERFLDKDGCVINKSKVIPFSLGSRSCPGETLAREEVFLFVSGILQNFVIRPPEGKPSINVKIHRNIVETPFPYEIRMIPRELQ